jgi:hypothetical protein
MNLLEILTPHNPHQQTISNAKFFNLFLESAATYFVLCYLLNYGERNTARVTITRNCEFFWEDMSSILGESKLKKFTPTIPVIPTAIREAIERGSPLGTYSFEDFLKICGDIYLKLRSHYLLFSNLLKVLFDTKPEIAYQFTPEYVSSCIKARFLPTSPDNIALETFLKVIRNPQPPSWSITKLSLW